MRTQSEFQNKQIGTVQLARRPKPNDCTTPHRALIPCPTCGATPPRPDELSPHAENPDDERSWSYWYGRNVRWGGDPKPTPPEQRAAIEAKTAKYNQAAERLKQCTREYVAAERALAVYFRPRITGNYVAIGPGDEFTPEGMVVRAPRRGRADGTQITAGQHELERKRDAAAVACEEAELALEDALEELNKASDPSRQRAPVPFVRRLFAMR